MTTTLRYQNVVHELVQRVLRDVAHEIHSIILFGSVARGEATEQSDIDLLIIMDSTHPTKKRIREIVYDLALEENLVVQLVFLTSKGFHDAAFKYRSYFAADVISQGEVLYDDGTYRRICEDASSVSAGVPER